MTTNTKYLLGGLAIAVVGIGAYMYFKPKKDNTSVKKTEGLTDADVKALEDVINASVPRFTNQAAAALDTANRMKAKATLDVNGYDFKDGKAVKRPTR